MACNKCHSCDPCNCSSDTPAPVLPHCDVILSDGTFANATVTVTGGCITDVRRGTLPVVNVEAACCQGGGGGDYIPSDCDCEDGDDGRDATVTVGQVNQVSYNDPVRVWNTGTPSNVVLNFDIPAGTPGDDGESPDPEDAEVYISGEVNPDEYGSLSASPPDANGFINITLDLTLLGNILQMMQLEIDGANEALAQAQSDIADLTQRLESVETDCCP